jgi:hypothetical protein
MDLAQFHWTLFGFYRLFQFSHFFFFWISSFFDLSITEETWVVEMRIWYTKIYILLVLHIHLNCAIFVICRSVVPGHDLQSTWRSRNCNLFSLNCRFNVCALSNWSVCCDYIGLNGFIDTWLDWISTSFCIVYPTYALCLYCVWNMYCIETYVYQNLRNCTGFI